MKTTTTSKTQMMPRYRSRIKAIVIIFVVLPVLMSMRGPQLSTLHQLNSSQHQRYEPAPIEQYILDNTERLGYKANGSSACAIWNNATLTTPSIHQSMTKFLSDLDQYRDILSKFNGSVVPDVRVLLTNEVCSSLEIHPEGLSGIFTSGQLSKGINGQGYMEPLLPPLRHPRFCHNKRDYLMDMSYLVLDFAAMCRGMKQNTKIILLDMGAALDFHTPGLRPAVYLAEMFRLFGMPFDHIYAFEVVQKDPAKVFNQIPDHLMTSFHWINVGIDAAPESKLNPLTSIIKKFNEDDLVIVKLDIDTPNIEYPLVQQLKSDPDLLRLVDHFFFEHHIDIREMKHNWGKSVAGTLDDTLKLFQFIRRAGPAAHYWV